MIESNDLKKDLKELIKIHDVIGISGAPGIGKSEIAYQVFEELGLKLLEVRLYEQGLSAGGLPILNSDITTFSKPWWFKIAEEEKPDGIFFDDFHSVPPEIQKFFYRLLTDGMIHNYSLGYKPKIILAGNFNIDSAGAAIIESPVMGRFEVMLEYKPTIDNFLKWANMQQNRFDTRILAFLKINPDKLYTEDPPPTSKFPSPRNWEHLSKNISVTNSPDYAPGIVGKDAGYLIQDFWDMLNTSVEEIFKNEPKDIKEQVIYSLILAQEYSSKFKKDKKYEEKICDYVVEKLNPDVMLLFARQVITKIKVNQVLGEWRKNRPKLFECLLELADNVTKFGG